MDGNAGDLLIWAFHELQYVHITHNIYIYIKYILYVYIYIYCGGGGPINSQKIHLLLKHHIPKEHIFFEKSGCPSKGPAKDF